MFLCLMARNEIPRPLLRWLEDFHSRPIATLLLCFRLDASFAALSLLPTGLSGSAASPPSLPQLRAARRQSAFGPLLPLSRVSPESWRPSRRWSLSSGKAVAVPCGDDLVSSFAVDPHCPTAWRKLAWVTARAILAHSPANPFKYSFSLPAPSNRLFFRHFPLYGPICLPLQRPLQKNLLFDTPHIPPSKTLANYSVF